MIAPTHQQNHASEKCQQAQVKSISSIDQFRTELSAVVPVYIE